MNINEYNFDTMAREEAESIISESLEYGSGDLEEMMDWAFERTDGAFPYYSDCHEICRNCDVSDGELEAEDYEISPESYDHYAFCVANLEYGVRVRRWIDKLLDEVNER